MPLHLSKSSFFSPFCDCWYIHGIFSAMFIHYLSWDKEKRAHFSFRIVEWRLKYAAIKKHAQPHPSTFIQCVYQTKWNHPVLITIPFRLLFLAVISLFFLSLSFSRCVCVECSLFAVHCFLFTVYCSMNSQHLYSAIVLWFNDKTMSIFQRGWMLIC